MMCPSAIRAPIALMLLSLGGIVTTFLFATFYTHVVITETSRNDYALTNNSLVFEMWRKLSSHTLTKVHIFNYTNWEEVQNNSTIKLHVEEVGPYVYKKHTERVNINFNGDYLSFHKRSHFDFDPTSSSGAHFDKVNVPNIPLLALLAKATNLPFFHQVVITSAIDSSRSDSKPFLQLPVQRFLWGYEDYYGHMMNMFFPEIRKSNNYGLLATENGTNDRIMINTGYDLNKLDMLEEFNGKRKLHYWGSPGCNSIEDASEGFIFPPPLLKSRQPLAIYFPDLCRKIPFEYVGEVTTNDGDTLLRYAMPRDVFDDPARNPANGCYCDVDSGTCPPRGVINVTACAMIISPGLVSFPHFSLGDSALLEHITGLHPDPEFDTPYVDVHPKLGVVVRGKTRLQLNIQVKKMHTEGIILPVAWIETTVEEHLKDFLTPPPLLLNNSLVELTVLALSSLTLVVSFIWLFVGIARLRKSTSA